MEIRDLDLLIARQSIGSMLKQKRMRRTKRDDGGEYILVILCAVLVCTIEADDLYLCLALCEWAPSFLERGVEVAEGRTGEGVFGLDAHMRVSGRVFLLLFLFEGECHHAPGDVFHSLSVREVCFRASIHLPDLCCKGILLGEFLGIGLCG